jgi:formate-dependent nitrite reductase membrane component NrfD
MKGRSEIWGWKIALYFFIGGMDGSSLLLAGIAEIIFGGGRTSYLASYLDPIFIAIGSMLLVFDLGRPRDNWRVFMNPKSLLTIGAVGMTLACGVGILYASFLVGIFPWTGWVMIRQLLAVAGALLGVLLAIYPGVLVGSQKARPFWNGPGMPILFTISSLATGIALEILCGLLMPPPTPGVLEAILSPLAAVLLVFQLLFWCLYVWMKYASGSERECLATRRWVNGDFALPFKGGFLFLGTFVPLVLLLTPGAVWHGIAAALILLGGLLMRFLVITAGEDRTWLPGEEKYLSRLPLGTEAFLQAWCVEKPAGKSLLAKFSR